MYHKSRGIVLHTIKYSETSVIAKIYTEKSGLLSFIVKGVRSAKSKTKASLMQPLTILDLEFQQRENKSLLFIKEFKRAYTYHSLPFDTVKSAIGLFILEVITKSIREHEPNEEMFEFICDALLALDKTDALNSDFHLLFLILFSKHLGFQPHGNFSEENSFFEMREGVFINSSSGVYTLDKTESKAFNELMQENIFGKQKSKLSRAVRKQMLKALMKYYRLHLENFSLNSPEVLETILE